MRDIDLRGVDLNLLVVFAAVMRSASVTRAAQQLGLGQPAVSHALSRLRMLAGDPLFVRDGRAFRPTSRAQAMFEAVAPALEEIEAELRARPEFDPQATERVFHLGASDDLQLALVPALVQRLESEAPSARLIVRHADYRSAGDLLDRGEADLVIGFLRRLPASAKIVTIRKYGFCCLRSDQLPGPLDLDAYCALPHALVTFAGDLSGLIDEALQALGRSRTVQVALPQFASLPALLEATALLATVPDYAAPMLSANRRLIVDPLPFSSPTFDLSLAWGAAADRDPADTWFRSLVVEQLRSL